MRTALVVGVLALTGCGGKGGSTPAGDPGPKADATPAEFDANDPVKTVRWMAAKRDEAEASVVPGNALSKQNAGEQLRKELNKIVGKEVRWPSTVGEVRGNGRIIVLGASHGVLIPGKYVRQFVVHFHRSTPLPDGPELPAALPTNPPKADWVARLRKGDAVVVIGTVGEVRVEEQVSDNSHPDTPPERRYLYVPFTVWLKNPRVELP